MKRICSIYKSPRKNEMYLYVLKAEGLERVPEGLLPAFGTPIHAFDLVLSPERKAGPRGHHQGVGKPRQPGLPPADAAAGR